MLEVFRRFRQHITLQTSEKKNPHIITCYFTKMFGVRLAWVSFAVSVPEVTFEPLLGLNIYS